ncbi:hypothetical protein XH92_17650 [Bradyrhizobium sp. CCBAU 53421]|nr:hypothetical protein XH92_17650 [Bradyrhizobium sp. CCBAU 53421]
MGTRFEHRRPELGWLLGLIEQARYRVNITASLLAQQFGINRVHADIADCPEFNAFAAIDQDVCLVGITSTVLHCLYPLAGIIARYYESTTSLEGPIRQCLQDTNWATPESINRCCSVIQQFGPLVPPEAQRRHTDLFWNMLNIIVHHEFAHLYLGHVGYNNTVTGIAKLNEVQTISQVEQQLWHAMEIQADIGICLYLVALCQRRPQPDLELIILASYVVFSLLRILSPEESSSHPHPLVRLILLLNRTGNEAKIEIDRMRERIRERVSRLRLNFFEHGIDRPFEELHRQASEIEEASNNKYIALFRPFRIIPPS